jgi:hypothetical protein
MERIFALVLAFAVTLSLSGGLSGLLAPALASEGGGRDIQIPFEYEEDEEEAKDETEAEPEYSYEGLFARGKAGIYGHVAVRLGDRLDLRGELSYAYSYVDGVYEPDTGTKNPIKALTGLFKKKKDEPEEIDFGTAVIHRNHLYILRRPGSAFDFSTQIDETKDIEIVEDFEGGDRSYRDWGVRLEVGYQYNRLSEEMVGGYDEARTEGSYYGDVTYKNNHFVIRAPLKYDW